jgi:hypothetical protein
MKLCDCKICKNGEIFVKGVSAGTNSKGVFIEIEDILKVLKTLKKYHVSHITSHSNGKGKKN